MGIHRLNHAVLYVRDVKRSVEFYSGVMGFRVVNMTPDGFRGAAFMQAPDSTNDHDLGIFEIGAAAGPSEAGRRTRAGQSQDQIADELRPTIEAILDDLDRWLAPATK